MHSTPGEFLTHSGKSERPIITFTTALLLLFVGAAQAQFVIPGNNGQDGVFAPNANVEVDLSLAVTGQWDTTASTRQGDAEAETDLVSGLVARYTFSGNAEDTSGNGNNGIPDGALLSRDRNNEENSAYAFDGEDDAIFVSDDPSLDISSAITLTAWVNPTSQKTAIIITKGVHVNGEFTMP